MSENFPFNKLNREAGEKKLAEETFNRVTRSFYKYVIIPDPNELRNTLFFNWKKLQVLGRIYLASEGINAGNFSMPDFLAFAAFTSAFSITASSCTHLLT